MRPPRLTESDWLDGDDPHEMFYWLLWSNLSSQRRTDLVCVACARSVLPLATDEETKRAFDWLEEHPGERPIPDVPAHVQSVFHGPVYEYAFPNLNHLFSHYPVTLRENPRVVLCATIREIFGHPFRPVAFDPAWRTDTALTLAKQMYDAREFSATPILADALQDAGCDAEELLSHLRDPSATHVRGCWAIDLVLGKE
jgi:hypothetical protein